jgi:hypothetical protein
VLPHNAPHPQAVLCCLRPIQAQLRPRHPSLLALRQAQGPVRLCERALDGGTGSLGPVHRIQCQCPGQLSLRISRSLRVVSTHKVTPRPCPAAHPQLYVLFLFYTYTRHTSPDHALTDPLLQSSTRSPSSTTPSTSTQQQTPFLSRGGQQPWAILPCSTSRCRQHVLTRS